jgi:hypothetical protein
MSEILQRKTALGDLRINGIKNSNSLRDGI